MRLFLAVLVVAWGLPALAQEKPEDIPAPLDLKWGLSAQDVRAMGVSLEIVEEDGAYGAVYDAKDLASLVEDGGLVKLYFGFDDELWRIVIYSRRYLADRHAGKVMRRYQQLNALLTDKYGPGQQNHVIGHANSRDIAASIAKQNTTIATYYDKRGLFIGLEVKAQAPDITYWMLLYAHKELSAKVNEQKKSKEKNRL